MWETFAGLVALALGIWAWWAKNNDAKKKADEARRKEIHDAVHSGDVSRIHAIVDRMRK